MLTPTPLGQRTADPPLFPDPTVLDTVLYAYLRRADRMGWSPYDLVTHDKVRQLARVDRLSPEQRSAVLTVLYVEDHLPGYMAEYLRHMTGPELADAQHIVNRQALHFVFRWAAEEDRHAHVLEMYLTRTGLMTRAALDADLLRERKTEYHFPYDCLVESFIYLALQEKATHLYYRALAQDIDEPLLKVLLRHMANDEASHAKFFYDLLLKCQQGDLRALAKKVVAVARDFRMPVQTNLTNYRVQILGLMRAAPAYRHADVLANLQQALERAVAGREPEALSLVTPEGVQI
ncbi:MAG TPA: acyl-ACP desaturase [Gemmataceae bacterium]|jgi:rubrerythrin|nr:acyl-ACP desaturase [Gemmataceae bacterium]